ncbi:MAG TPA: hypothetical protein VK689_04760 [Armatimonadota bacterium]|nr:hypothetical protein [Armatimonadota bacterium]
MKSTLIREPVIPPGTGAHIIRAGELPDSLGWRESWVLLYVCITCRHRYLDFSVRLTYLEADQLAKCSNHGSDF